MTLRNAILTFASLAFLFLLGGCDSKPVSDRAHTVVWLYPIDENRSMVQELVKKFENENPDIHIDIRAVPGAQYQTKLKTLVASGSPPDVFVCGDVLFAYLKPFLADLTDLAVRDKDQIHMEDFYPAVLKATTVDNRIYFLPQTFNVSLLYYNKKIFKDVGLAYPTADWTWDDYRNAGLKVQAYKARTGADVYGSTIILGWWGEWLNLVHGSGGDLFNPEVTRCTLDSPEAIQGISFYLAKIGKDGFSPRPGYGPSTGFASGKYAMEFGGHTGNWPTYRKIKDLDWDVEALPKGPKGVRGGEISVGGLGISRDTTEKEAAWKFLVFMTSPNSIRRFMMQGWPPIRKSIAAEVPKDQKPECRAALERGLASATPIPSTPDFIEIALDIVQPEIDSMIEEGQDPRIAAGRATKAANAFLKATSRNQ